MFKFEDIINERFDSYPDEIREQMRDLRDKLRESLIDAIIEGKIDRLQRLASEDTERFKEQMYFIFLQGQKSMEKMSTKVLVDMYLENEGSEKFMELIQNL